MGRGSPSEKFECPSSGHVRTSLIVVVNTVKFLISGTLHACHKVKYSFEGKC